MAGVLKVVCTPIGNLGDLTPRAKQSLQDAGLIVAEDTRHTKQLMLATGILSNAKILSCHQHNELERLDVVCERLRLGEDVVLVSDAGAPSISDPGGRLVEAVVNEGFRVEAIPGASALVAALMGAGLNTSRFVFLGFLPKKGKERRKLLSQFSAIEIALIFYESIERTEDTLHDLFEACGPRRVVVARELTKKFETFHRGILGQALYPKLELKGEVVIIVESGEEIKASQEDIANDTLKVAKDKNLSPKEATKILMEKHHLSRKDAYDRVLNARNNS